MEDFFNKINENSAYVRTTKYTGSMVCNIDSFTKGLPSPDLSVSNWGPKFMLGASLF